MSSFNYMPPSFVATQGELFLNDNLDILEGLEEVIATHNKNCLILESKPNLAPFTKAKFIFQITGNIFEGNTINLSSPAMGSLLLTAKDEPSILEFLTTASPATATEIAEDIARALNDSIIFNRFYVASAFSPTVVVIEALTFGSSFTISFNSVGSFIPLGGGSAGSDKFRAQELDNYGTYLQVFIGEGYYGDPIDKSSMIPIGTIEKKYNAVNQFEYDVAGLLKSYTNSPPPNFANSVWIADFKPLLPYVVLGGESYSLNNSFRRKYLIFTTEVRWANNSAVNTTSYCLQNGLENYVVRKGVVDRCFLTNQPAKKTTLNTYENLSFIVKEQVNDQIRAGYLTIIPTFRDNTVGAEELVRSYIFSRGGQYTIDTSPQFLNLQAIETAAGKKIVSYTLQLRYANQNSELPTPLSAELVTKSQEYILGESCDSITIAFLNALGVFDTIELKGEDLDSINRKTVSSIRSLDCCPTNYDIIRGLKEANVEPIRTVSEWVESKEEYKWLLELAAAAEAYEIKSRGELGAIVLSSVNIREDRTTNKYSLEIEFFKSAPFNALTL